MQVEVTFLTRRGPDALMRKTQTVTAESLRFGRGTDNEISLADIRVALHAAVITLREAGLFIERAGEEPVEINGASVPSSTLKPGDKIEIGPYEVVVVDPPQGFDAAITIELVHPLGDTLERIVGQSHIGLAQAGWSKRRWAWGLFLLFAILGLVLPIAVFPVGKVATSARSVPPQGAVSVVDMSWNPGDISNPHRFFAWNCATCHTSAFASVPDQTCLSCHSNVGSHFDPAADLGPVRHELETTRCGECHEEHRGVHSLVIRANDLCVSCHSPLQQTAPKAGFENVSGFPAGHPQFRATLVADASRPIFLRRPLDSDPPPKDNSGLVFSHAAHLIPTGFLTPQGRKVMVCADCHKPDAAGQGFLPITFEGDCHSCHDLKFDAQLPWQEVPHGDVAMVQNAVQDFYARMALQGGVQDPEAPAIVRRPVGTIIEPTPAERQDALSWAARRTAAAMTLIDDPKRGCSYCHETQLSDGKLSVAPVLLRDRFLPNAAFDHSKHQAMQCAECHDSAHSEKSSDVLIPGLNTCIGCHGTERADFKAQSDCTSCHLFHQREFGPMKTANAAH